MGEQMWETRPLPSRVIGPGAKRSGRAGPRDDALRLGRAAPLRLLDRSRYQRVRTRLDHKGPYMPLILQACRESELAYEYRHGVIAYGAFTYALSRRIRDDRHGAITFAQLCDSVGRTLKGLGYEQHPEVDGPDVWVNAGVPWLGGARGATPRRIARPVARKHAVPRRKPSPKKTPRRQA